MSKRCPVCHTVNEDSRLFCTACGVPLDAKLRLIQNLERQQELLPHKEKRKEDMSFYVSREPKEEKKRAVWPWIVLGLAVAAAAVAAWFFLNG